MPISIVVGGQFGSEGKGKVALDLVRRDPSVTIAVRPGGTNSGHTGYSKDGRRIILRQLPAAAIDGGIKVVLPAGSYIDVQLLLQEIEQLGLSRSQLVIDPRAHIILPEHLEWERRGGLGGTIGSTGSGTGGSVMARLARNSPELPGALQAAAVDELKPYISETVPILLDALQLGERIVIEGTQGFGLSPVHGDHWPNATSRDTTAAGFLAETGLSPLDADDVVLVFRAFPIRVGGNSGPLASEIDWSLIRKNAGSPVELTEWTSVTKKIRRVAEFDYDVAARAIAVNRPTRIVLNHIDHVDWACRAAGLSNRAWEYIRHVEQGIGRSIDWVGTSEEHLVRLTPSMALRA